MPSGYVNRKNQYYDSVYLMGVNKRLSEIDGVQQAAVLMGSEKNKELLVNMGIQDEEVDAAKPNDLIVAVIALTTEKVSNVLTHIDEWFTQGEGRSRSEILHRLEDGIALKPKANLVVISIPGEHAAREARKALEAGLNVFMFSDNVSIDDELKLKLLARQRGLLVMGPDCGTAFIQGVGIGFANAVRRGSIGVIGAAGTGLQEFTCQVHNAGLGISHAIGTGSHDLSDKVGGITTFDAIDRLEADPNTRVITIISKPLSPQIMSRLVQRLKACRKPIVGCFLGTRMEQTDGKTDFQYARTIDEATSLAVKNAGGVYDLQQGVLSIEELEQASIVRCQWGTKQKFLRGVFAGGTFCYQSQQIFQDAHIPIYSNAPFESKYQLADPNCSFGHTMVDMGEDYFTLGKPHPMIDSTLRKQRILAEAKDPQAAILLLDFILGYNVSANPVGELLDAIREAQEAALRRGGLLTVVASVCGTEGDQPEKTMQITLLQESGVIVFDSNARAAQFCCELLRSRQEG